MGLLSDVSVEPVILFSSFAFYVESTTLQDLVFTKVCMDKLNTTSIEDCSGPHAQNNSILNAVAHEQSALISSYATLASLLSIPVCLYIGSWSDMFGRRKPLVLPFLFYIFSQISLLTCSFCIHLNILPFIYLTPLFEGIAGGVSAIFAISFGYLSDITQESNRTKRNVILESMWYVGGCLGFLTTAMTENIPFRKYEITFASLAVTHAFIILYILFGLKEARQLCNTNRSSLFKFKHVKDCFATVFKKREPSVKRWLLTISMLAVVILQPSSAAQGNLTFSFLKRPPLKWDTEWYSLYNAAILVTSGFGLIVVLPLLLKLLGRRAKDSLGVVLGGLFKAAGLVCLALATDARFVFLSAAFYTFGDFPLPSIRSLSSKVVDEDERGKILSFIAVVQTSSFCVASSVLGYVFTTFSKLPSLSYFIAALLQLVVAMAFTFVGCYLEGPHDYVVFVDENCNEVSPEKATRSKDKHETDKAQCAS